MAIKVCLDAGHGGADSGGVGFGRKEKDDTLKLAQKIRSLLIKQNIEVIMTRSADTNVSLATRTALANREKCEYFLSIHRDAFSDASANGSTVYVYSNAKADTVAKATAIYDATVRAGQFRKRGLKKGAPNYTDFAVNRDTVMHACLLEVGFITNKNDNALFDARIDDIALSIAKAVCNVLGITYIESKPKTKAPTVKEFQQAAIKDGYKFPKFGADGMWGAETEAVATMALLRRTIVYRNKNLTALVQKVVGVKVDGLYGKDTEKAVKEYQVKYGLTPDGIVGINTYQKMLGVK